MTKEDEEEERLIPVVGSNVARGLWSGHFALNTDPSCVACIAIVIASRRCFHLSDENVVLYCFAFRVSQKHRAHPVATKPTPPPPDKKPV